MSASLVGSEMCIRDSNPLPLTCPPCTPGHTEPWCNAARSGHARRCRLISIPNGTRGTTVAVMWQ
eukprot:13806514-Alexandrium_andersonii.AAC.1